jgi:small subunit ribosomal protein S17
MTEHVQIAEGFGPGKIRVGRVVSDKMQKTIIIEIQRSIQHPLYKKYIQRSKKLYVHDEKGQAHIGDLVKVVESRPLSKTKRWRLLEIVERAK